MKRNSVALAAMVVGSCSAAMTTPISDTHIEIERQLREIRRPKRSPKKLGKNNPGHHLNWYNRNRF